ncbi:MAG: hypothetical protein ACOY71_03085 [Gemmatimonadota bacterium]
MNPRVLLIGRRPNPAPLGRRTVPGRVLRPRGRRLAGRQGDTGVLLSRGADDDLAAELHRLGAMYRADIHHETL